MAKKQQLGITVKKSEDIAEWYNQVVLKAQLADYSDIKGCMVIRPNGYAIWENITDGFNKAIKKKGVRNAYFPLFIPESFFQKEAEHAEGFAPEVAWVENKEKDQERLAIRPTSETIMYNSYSKWIRSWRDLPLRINQWCNIVRWEVSDVKLFLRSREFLWQEGHCVYATEDECKKETLMFLNEYKKFIEGYLAIPLIDGYKTEKEKFAGAVFTTTIETMMPDGKALQCGTSHHLGDGFAKAFGIEYVDKDEKKKHPFQTSWGISTRLIGATVMLHSDDRGLVLPPKIAPLKAVIVPILFDDTKDAVLDYAAKVSNELDLEHECNTREDMSAGFKFADSELKGIPLRIEVGPKDLEKQTVVIVRRDTLEKTEIRFDELKSRSNELLALMQKDMFAKAKKNIESSIITTDNYDEFKKGINDRKMVLVNFCGEKDCEDLIKADTIGATSRVIPFDQKAEGQCIKCKEKAKHKVYFAKNY
jgi:prolyl-tRNA synthetase